MGVCERGVQTLLTTGGAFAAFGLMSIAVGTDFWLYSRGNCRSKGGGGENDTSRKNEEVMTHSGLWRTCCLEGSLKGRCKKIDHFPEDADFDSAEYVMRVVRASSVFPILSVALLLFGGLCIAVSRFYKSKNNIVLSAGIFFVSAGLSNIIGIIVYISANVGDPNQSQSKKNNYSYGWSFYFGALSFIVAEMVGVLAVRIYIDNHRLERARFRPDFLRKSAASAAAAAARVPAYVYRYRRRSRSPSRSRSRSRSSSRSSDAPLSSLHQQQQGGGGGVSLGLPMAMPPMPPPMPSAAVPLSVQMAMQQPRSRDGSPVAGKGFSAAAAAQGLQPAPGLQQAGPGPAQGSAGDIAMYTLGRGDGKQGAVGGVLAAGGGGGGGGGGPFGNSGGGGGAGMNMGGDGGFVQHAHNCVHKDMQDVLTSTVTNRRTTPV